MTVTVATKMILTQRRKGEKEDRSAFAVLPLRLCAFA
jgi:hypothetical protein